MITGPPHLANNELHNHMIIIPLLDDGRLVLVVRKRSPEESSLEFPAGFDTATEVNWRDTADRTLLERTGLVSPQMHVLGGVYHECPTSVSRLGVVLAEKCAAPTGETSALGQSTLAGILEVSRDDLEQRVRQGDIEDSLTLAAYAIYLV